MEHLINLVKKYNELGDKIKEARLQFAELRDLDSFNNYQKVRQEYRSVDLYGEIYSFELMTNLSILCTSREHVLLYKNENDCLYGYLDKSGIPVLTLSDGKKSLN